MKTILLPLALVASLGAVVPASASGLIDIQRVPYKAQDLQTDNGVRLLERRVANAVFRVCHRTVRRPLHEHAAFQNCRDTASADARDQIDQAVRLARTTAAR